MKKWPWNVWPILLFLLVLQMILWGSSALAQSLEGNRSLDERVREFLDSHRHQWRDLNVPAVDGQILHDLIIRNDYRRAGEIGTSTDHSAIWMAWALSKTGGKLITTEINETRYRKALANFEEAGLSDYIDERLTDAQDSR